MKKRHITEIGERDGIPLAWTRNRAVNVASPGGQSKAVQGNGLIYSGDVRST